MNELNGLKAEVRAQHGEMTSLLSEITKRPVAASQMTSPDVLHQLEGVWRNEAIDSTYCMRIVGDELRVAYAYGGAGDLTSHFYNCQVIGDRLLCRFKWFSKEDISGFVALRLTSPTVLEGGWQYGDQVLKGHRRSLVGKTISVATGLPPTLTPDDPTLIPLVLVTDENATCPEWAIRYFHKYKRE
jgi:hypothetical protein